MSGGTDVLDKDELDKDELEQDEAETEDEAALDADAAPDGAEPDAEDPEDAEDAEDAEARTARRTRRTLVAALVVVVLAIGAAVYGYLSYRDLQELRAERSDGEAAVRAASEELLVLFSLSADTSQADVDRLLEGSTASFRGDLQDQAQALQESLSAAGVQTTGEIDSAALVSIDDATAVVLVAGSQVLENTETESPEPRYYRVQVEMQKVEGEWLVAKLDFVGMSTVKEETVAETTVAEEAEKTDKPESSSREITLRLPTLSGLKGVARRGGSGAAGRLRRLSARTYLGLAFLLLLVAVAGAGWVWHQERTAQQLADARAEAMAAAERRVPVLLSYDFADIDSYAADAAAQTTGDFTADYEELVTEAVIPAATEQQLVNDAAVSTSGVVSASADEVVVLALVTQSTVQGDVAEPTLRGYRLEVTMKREGDDWLIAGFEPV